MADYERTGFHVRYPDIYLGYRVVDMFSWFGKCSPRCFCSGVLVNTVRKLTFRNINNVLLSIFSGGGELSTTPQPKKNPVSLDRCKEVD